MTKSTLLEKYPVKSLTIKKSDTNLENVEQFMEHFKTKIEADIIGKFIAIFDHYEHTTSLEGHEIADGIVDAKNIIFCFGQKIPNPKILAIRPRSIAVVEEKDSFTVSFMQAPMQPINEKMISWVKATLK